MGVESGGGDGGRVPRGRKISEGRPSRNDDITVFFLTHENFAFSTIFKIKWPKSEEKLNFEGGWVSVPMNPSHPNKTSWRRPCIIATATTAARRDNSGSWMANNTYSGKTAMAGWVVDGFRKVQNHPIQKSITPRWVINSLRASVAYLGVLTRAPLGGLFRAPPLSFFLQYIVNQCRYHHQTWSTLSRNNFTHCGKILKSRVS